MTRRAQRRVCEVCGQRATVKDDDQLGQHYRTGRRRWDGEKPCLGGHYLRVQGEVQEVTEPPILHRQPPPSEGELSVRALRGGLPTLGRR